MDECMGLPKEKLGEVRMCISAVTRDQSDVQFFNFVPFQFQWQFDELSAPVAQDVEFIFIRLNVLREVRSRSSHNYYE